MADCTCLAECPFFNDKMANMPKVAEMVKNKFCRGDNTECARHMVFLALGKEKVPGNLFPRHTDRAKEIIAEG